jgi:hypothetical protein
MPKKGKQKAQQQKQKQKGKKQQQQQQHPQKVQQQKKQQQQQQHKQKGKKGGAPAKGGASAAGGSELDAIGAELRQLAGSQPGTGMLLAQLPTKYKAMFKKDLAAAEYGFGKLKLLVEACSSHVGMRQGDGGHEWVFQAPGGKAAGKRAAADAAEEPKPKKQKQKTEQPPAAAAAAAAPPKNPEEVKLKFLEGKEKKGQLTEEQSKALAELRDKLGLEAPAPAPPPAAPAPVAAAADRSAKRKPAVLDRLGMRPSLPDDGKRPRTDAPVSDTRAVETAPTTDDVFLAVASAGGAGGVGAASKAVVVSALRRFTDLVQDPKLGASEYETTRRAVVYNQAFHLLLGNLGAAVAGAQSSELADVFFALQALNYPRDKDFAEEPLLRKLIDALLSTRPPPKPYELSVAVWSLAKLRVRRMDLSLLHELCEAVPRNASLAELDGESVGKFFWALSACDDHGEKLFGDFQFPKLIRALLGECGGAFSRWPMAALMDVVAAYSCVGSAFEEDQKPDMQSVSTFLSQLEARAGQLSVDELLLLLRSLQHFPSSEVRTHAPTRTHALKKLVVSVFGRECFCCCAVSIIQAAAG